MASVAGVAAIAGDVYLTYHGVHAGTPDALEIATPKAVVENGPAAVARWNEGRIAIAQSG